MTKKAIIEKAMIEKAMIEKAMASVRRLRDKLWARYVRAYSNRHRDPKEFKLASGLHGLARQCCDDLWRHQRPLR